MPRPTAAARGRGQCSVCEVYKNLTPGGAIKLHKRHDVRCEGSLLPPRALKERPTDTWSAARRATFERDAHRCRKCSDTEYLEAHHMKERCDGGSDDLSNLITLCSDCHAEWTFCQPPGVPFGTWLALPSARHFTSALVAPWPVDMSAAAFKERLFASIRVVLELRRQTKDKPR